MALVPTSDSSHLPLDRLPLAHLSAKSQADFVRYGFAESAPMPEQRLEEIFLRHAVTSPDQLAVIDADGDGTTYAELNAAADLLATDLSGRGVKPGDRVGLFLDRGLELVVGILGILKSGAAWVPQDARIATSSVLSSIVDLADIDLIVTNQRCARLVDGTSADVLILIPGVSDAPAAAQTKRGEDGCARGDVPTLPRPSSVAAVIFTSGTTGTPNGVQVTHTNLLNTVLVGPANLGIEPGMRVGQLLNIAFDMSVWEIFGALLHGATLVIRGADIEATASTVDVVIATPSVLGRLNPRRCRRVQIVAVAGERCPESLAATWREFTRFHNSCGPTEVTIVNTVHELSDGDQLTIGAPIPNTTAYVLDENLQPVETGEMGTLWAGGACVTAGYLNNSELTAERYRPDPFTGGTMFNCRDLVSWTPEGRLLHHGRTDDQVKVRGFRVELDAVTNTLERAVGITQATTWVNNGALVSAIAIRTPATRLVSPDHQQVRHAVAELAESLPYYYQPEQFLLVPSLPITARGKVDTSALNALVDEARAVAAA